MSKRNSKIADLDDSSLVVRFQSGDREAFEEIDRRYRPRLLRFLRSRTGSLELAEEVVQETLTRALSTLENLNSGVFLSCWLHRIAFRKVVDLLRRERSTIGGAIAFDEDSRSERDDLRSTLRLQTGARAVRLPDGVLLNEYLPDQEAERRDYRENLWRVARNNLSDDEFCVLWSIYVDEMNDKEIAIALGKSRGAIRVILTRARKKLAKYLIESGDG